MSSRVELSRSPSWTVSGAWTPEGELVLVDPLAKKLYRYAKSGELRAEIQNPKSYSWPSLIEATPGGYLLESEPGSFISLNADFKAIRTIDVLAKSRSKKHRLGAIYGWRRLGGDNLIAFSDVQNADGSWISAFVKVPFGDPAAFTILQTIATSDPMRSFYLLGYPYVAAVGETGYFVVMAEFPYLVEVAPNGEKRQLPLRFSRDSRIPALPDNNGVLSVPDLFLKLEESELVAGLYGFDGGLYLLLRSPALEGATRWSVKQLDLRTGQPSYSFRLQTQANHLTVVPGVNAWGFVEKKSVEGLGIQEIPSVLLVPSDAIERRRR